MTFFNVSEFYCCNLGHCCWQLTSFFLQLTERHGCPHLPTSLPPFSSACHSSQFSLLCCCCCCVSVLCSCFQQFLFLSLLLLFAAFSSSSSMSGTVAAVASIAAASTAVFAVLSRNVDNCFATFAVIEKKSIQILCSNCGKHLHTLRIHYICSIPAYTMHIFQSHLLERRLRTTNLTVPLRKFRESWAVELEWEIFFVAETLKVKIGKEWAMICIII